MLSYGGQAAAAAAKFGRPLDLKCIAARIDAGERAVSSELHGCMTLSSFTCAAPLCCC